MKKAIYDAFDGYTYYIFFYDLNDYIILKEDNQRISDKYIDYSGEKINTYKKLKKGDVLLKLLYEISFRDDEDYEDGGDYFYIGFSNLSYYIHHKMTTDDIKKIYSIIKSKSSMVEFEVQKKTVLSLFLEQIKAKSY